MVARALINSGAIHSFASKEYVRKLGRQTDQLEMQYSVTLPSGEILLSNQIIRTCPVQIDGRELFMDLVVLNMPNYEVILDMDWLTKYNAFIDCRKKIVVF